MIFSGQHPLWIAAGKDYTRSRGIGNQRYGLAAPFFAGAAQATAGAVPLQGALVIEDAPDGVMEFLEDFQRDHDGVAAAADVFCNLNNPAAGIFLEVEEELFALRDDFFGHQWRGALALVSVAAAFSPVASAPTSTSAAPAVTASVIVVLI